MAVFNSLEVYQDVAQDYLREGLIREVQFSGPTYQIEVLDRKTKSPFWVFLQTDHNHVKDLFCSCETSTSTGLCEHVAAAVLYVFGARIQPVHEQFYTSFWYTLFSHFVRQSGVKEPIIRKKGVEVSVVYGKDTLLFQARGAFIKNTSFFDATDAKETEENSIKFSNLNEEELEAWRQGRPSTFLRFELSFLSDLAKYLFMSTLRGEPYHLHFHVKDEKLPDHLTIYFSTLDIEIELPLSQELLLELIPTLKNLHSNLTLIDPLRKTVAAIQFDQKKGQLQVELDPAKLSTTENKKQIGSYAFLPTEGFLQVPVKISSKAIFASPHEIELFLNEYHDLCSTYLSQFQLSIIPKPLTYALAFQANKGLRIDAYLFEKGDIDWYFGKWVFVQGKKAGFYRIFPPKFEVLPYIVTLPELSHFVMQHRIWLSAFPGYVVHLSKLEEQLDFQVDRSGNLRLFTSIAKHKIRSEHDVGDFTYVAGDGFYRKESFREQLKLPKDVPIASHLVADFIRQHQELLAAVPGFFAVECPVQAVGLKIGLKQKDTITIEPEYHWIHPKDAKETLFFDEFVYVAQKGFYRLPASFRPIAYLREIHRNDSEEWDHFFIDMLDKLKSDFQCKVDPRLESVKNLQLVARPLSNLSEEAEEWDLDLALQAGADEITLQELLLASKRGERFVPTEIGTFDLTNARFGYLRDLENKKQIKVEEKKGFAFSKAELFRLQAFGPIHIDARSEQVAIFERLLQLMPSTPPQYPLLVSDLRTYQKNGVEWLWFLYQNRLSGLLCDDMGVGKTHQAMGLIASVIESLRHEKKKGVFLIVCPTSLLYHWEEKLARFLPQMKVKMYFGIQRTLKDFPGDFDILLTSYGIWRNEVLEFKKFTFEVAFFDELQIAKNHVSQIYGALLQCRSRMKIGLTGTPIENQLRELKALFDLVLPGYMPDESGFRDYFVKPIEKGDSTERRGLLARFVRPFVLRRRKQDVLPDLPEKTEDMVLAELQGEQVNLYKAVAAEQTSALLDTLRDSSAPIPYMHIFALLSALKQICNHPAAYLRDVENYEHYESGKWDAFLELLEEAQESNQKVVVFSQYLAMLDILEAYLTKQGIGFAQIRGKTRLRGDEVKRFNEDPTCRVFLGSLQAAGLGIDLTAASVVIHYDRWWNPARENQATDRVHRIGQTRGVQVFKLLTKNTIEERIDRMITRKKNLLENVVSFDDHQIVKRLTRQEIVALLEGLTDL